MTAQEFASLIARAVRGGLSRRWLAQRVRRSNQWIYRQERGAIPPDPMFAGYVERLIAAIASVPVPTLSDRRFSEDEA